MQIIFFTLSVFQLVEVGTAAGYIGGGAKNVGNGFVYGAKTVGGYIGGGAKNVGAAFNSARRFVPGTKEIATVAHPELHKFANQAALAASVTGGLAMAGGIGYMAADHAMNKKAVAHEAQLQVLESGVKVQESKVQNHAMNRTPVQAPEAQVEAPEAQVQAPEAQEQEFQEKVKRGVVFADAVAEDLLSDETDIAIPDEPSPINRSPIVRPL